VNDLDIARTAARAAGEAITGWFHRIGAPDLKGSVDPVTEADREAEERIVAVIRSERPDDGILAEEGSASEARSGRRWVIDPLDGTVNFVHGIPQVAVSVALEDDGGGLAAVVLDVFRGEEFAAERGAGATLDGSPITVSDGRELHEAVFSTGFAYDRQQHGAAYAAAMVAVMAEARGVRRLGSAALDLAWVSCGRYDGHWEFGLKPWDLAAGALLVREAGGIVTDSLGGPARPEDVVAAAPGVHERLRSIVAAHRPDHIPAP
jgi:myo-inositol-1(or 4)-monophosphatase